MVYCNNCGEKNDNLARFCDNCGTNLKKTYNGDEYPAKAVESYGTAKKIDTNTGYHQPKYQPPGYNQMNYQPISNQGYQPQSNAPGFRPQAFGNQRTGWLNFVIVLNWIGIGFLVLIGLLFVLLGGAEYFGSNGLALFVSLIFFGLAALLFALNNGLKNYNNTTRIIQLILVGLSFVGSLTSISSNLLSLIINGLVIYALGFHKETVNLFTNKVPY